MRKSKIFQIILRGIFVFFVPFLVTYFIYHQLSPSSCFTPPTGSVPIQENVFIINNIEEQASNYLNQKSEFIQSFAPIIQFGDNWFKYNVSFKNNLKVAIVVTQPKSYSEVPTTFSIQTQFGSSTIPYAKENDIAEGIESNQISSLITAFDFRTINPPIVVGPHQWVSLETNPNLGSVCIDIQLQQKYFFLMWIEVWVVFVGLMLILKESITLVLNGFHKYFISKI